MELLETRIKREYLEENKTVKEIAVGLNVGVVFIRRRLKLYGISLPQSRFKNGTKNGFIAQAYKIHKDRYDYSLFNYVDRRTAGIIICEKHGKFLQTPDSHLHGNGCQRCKSSKMENKIEDFLIDKKIKYQRQYIIAECKNKKPLPFDFAIWINEKLILIEYQGMQHFKEVKAWVNPWNNLEKIKFRDNIKSEYCKEHDIPLLIITYLENPISKLEEYLSVISKL